MSTLDDFFRDGSAQDGPVCSFCGSIEGELVVGVSDHMRPTHWHHKACKDQDDARKPSSEDVRKTTAKSNVYKVQLRAIRMKLWELDHKDEFTRQDRFDYDALENSDAKTLKKWRRFNTKNGLSNEAVV